MLWTDWLHVVHYSQSVMVLGQVSCSWRKVWKTPRHYKGDPLHKPQLNLGSSVTKLSLGQEHGVETWALGCLLCKKKLEQVASLLWVFLSLYYVSGWFSKGTWSATIRMDLGYLSRKRIYWKSVGFFTEWGDCWRSQVNFGGLRSSKEGCHLWFISIVSTLCFRINFQADRVWFA